MNLKQQIRTLKIELESLNKTFEDKDYLNSLKIIPLVLEDTKNLVSLLEQVENE